MGNPRKPRKGSMGVWPRKRANKMYARVRGWNQSAKHDKPILGFAGYKVGMTHIIGMDVKKTSLTKNELIACPVTILECPPLRIHAIRFYKKSHYGVEVDHDFVIKGTKELERKITVGKEHKNASELDTKNPDQYADVALVVYTSPKDTGLGKKTPELFEVKLSGHNKDKLEFAKSHIDKEISVEQIFKEGQYIDVHAVTKGKGTQGPIKRFRIALKPHKSEKGRRQPGSRGGWSAQQHVMYRTAYSGQMGFHQRVHYNTQIMKIGNTASDVNPKDGFGRYGMVKSTYMLVKGSVPGPKKRMIILTQPMRAPKKEEPLPNIVQISTQSKQGR
jgi:large subunit ribosomal protein L3